MRSKVVYDFGGIIIDIFPVTHKLIHFRVKNKDSESYAATINLTGKQAKDLAYDLLSFAENAENEVLD